MQEEVRRIEAAKQAGQLREASRSTNLTGEQIFYRSCNTCHPSGKKGMGPRLDMIAEHFPEDKALIALLRKGKGMMPAQTKDDINDEELKNLVMYVRTLSAQLNESSQTQKK